MKLNMSNMRNRKYINTNRKNIHELYYAYLVGLFEGLGRSFYISRKGSGFYLTYEFAIELEIKDVQIIYKLKSLLGVGVISIRKRGGKEMISLRIINKSHLKNYILPIFDKYPMFSNKQNDYLRFKNALLNNIIYYGAPFCIFVGYRSDKHIS